MAGPLVSVIIPTYNGAGFLGRAMRSVLDQTHSNLELIVVDDQSPDHTGEVVKQFDDPRIKYIRHEVNQGASTARVTGCRHSSGEIVAFLDQDDFFHPEKLEAHVAFLQSHPEIGFSYNPYFELVHSSDTIRTVAQPPKNVSLTDLTLGFYLPPSSWVVRREWIQVEDVWDYRAVMRGREIVICGRLFMAGCKFGRVDRVLHSRGYHGRRKVKNLEKNCNDEIACQEIVFSDPRCPADVAGMRPIANAAIHAMWSNVAFTQNETTLGRNFLWGAGQALSFLFLGNPSPYMSFLMGYCVDDESYDYETLLDLIFVQLPIEIPDVLTNYLWAVARGNFVRGIRALIWDRPEDGAKYLALGLENGFQVDEAFVKQVVFELQGYELAYGADATLKKLAVISPALRKFMDGRAVNWLSSGYLFNLASRTYEQGIVHRVPGYVLRAVARHPRYLADRGVVALLSKSILGIKPAGHGTG